MDPEKVAAPHQLAKLYHSGPGPVDRESWRRHRCAGAGVDFHSLGKDLHVGASSTTAVGE